MFQPAAGDNFEIDGKGYRVAPHPSAPHLPYGQEGRQAVVYKLRGEDGRGWALKVFKPAYRRPYLVRVAKRIAPYAELPGMEVCSRTVVSLDRNLELLRAYPDLVYAALMPWISGPTWMEILLSKKRLEPEVSLKLARSILRTLVSLEEEGLSHGDLSGANIVLPMLNGGGGVSLVDVEQLYGPGMERPEALPSSSPGYGFPNLNQPLWGPLTDRYPGSIILAEMLATCDERAVGKSEGESFFSAQELGKSTPRFSMMVDVLEQRWGDQISSIFQRNWFADTPETCAPFAEWLIHLPEHAQVLTSTISPEKKAVAEAKLAMTVPQQQGGIEGLLERAMQLRNQGSLKGSAEVYRYILETSQLSERQRDEIEGFLASIERKIEGEKASPPVIPESVIEATTTTQPPSPAPQRSVAAVPTAMMVKKQKKRASKKVLIPVAFVLAIALGLSLFFALSNKTSSLTVPNVVAMSQKDAKSALGKTGLKSSTKQKEDASAEAGKVVAQEPAANEKANKGQTVTLTVAIKPKVKVPSLIGVARDEALATVRQVGLNPVVSEAGTDKPTWHGKIISQDPPADTVLDWGSNITMQVGILQGTAAQQSTGTSTSQQGKTSNTPSSQSKTQPSQQTTTPPAAAPPTPTTPTAPLGPGTD